MTSITLTQSSIGTNIVIYAKTVRITGNKNNSNKPDVNGLDIVPVQTQSYENPKIVISDINLLDNGLSYSNILSLYKLKYDGTNAITLTIYYGDDLLVPSLNSTTSIKCVLEDFSITYDVSDSRDAYIPMANLTFIETK